MKLNKIKTLNCVMPPWLIKKQAIDAVGLGSETGTNSEPVELSL